jgi:hypothetical protein
VLALFPDLELALQERVSAIGTLSTAADDAQLLYAAPSHWVVHHYRLLTIGDD